MLWQRLLFGSLMIAALVGLFWLDGLLATQRGPEWSAWLLAPQVGPANHGMVVTLVWAFVALFATLEMGRLFSAAGFQPATTWACLVNVMGPVLSALLRTGARPGGSSCSGLGVVFCVLAGTAAVVAARKRTENATVNISVSLLMILYIGVLGSFIPRFATEASSAWLLLGVLLIIKSCDIGAYLIGRKIGRTKLIEWLSPKKTVEGLIGGVLVAAVVAVVIGWTWDLRPPRLYFSQIPWVQWGIFGALMGVLGQAGDLFESLIKRDLKVKDSGAVVPAFGGLLDILDSPLVCVPVAYYLLVY